MSSPLPVEWFLTDSRGNAVISWGLTALLVLAALDSLRSFRLVAVALAATAIAISITPAVLDRSWTRTVPWPLLLLGSLPLVLRAVDLTFFDLVLAGLSVSAIGMLLVVLLQMTTAVSMTPGFAIVSVVLATLAFSGVWALGSAVSAATLGTAFVSTNDELMRIFTAAALGGAVGGSAFRWYFRRQLRRSVASTRGEVRTE